MSSSVASFIQVVEVPAPVALRRASAIYLQFTFSEDPDRADAVRATLPETMRRAVPKRLAEFIAGRACARRALGQHDRSLESAPLAIGAGRAPEWPAGLVGSITHTRAIAGAAVARACDLAGIGIDSEPILSDRSIDAVLRTAVTESELACTQKGGRISERELATMIYSAKESLFKCLYPRVKVYFGFEHAAFDSVDGDAKTFRIRLADDLEGIAAGTVYNGTFSFSSGCVHTAIELVR